MIFELKLMQSWIKPMSFEEALLDLVNCKAWSTGLLKENRGLGDQFHHASCQGRVGTLCWNEQDQPSFFTIC